jgi:two-component system nitrate/nitrite response regulator NarL
VKILLCDDHVLLAEALETLLGAAGHEVYVTHTPDDALAALAEHQPDVCVLDIGFPDGDGLDALSRAADRSPETRVLMLSASRNADLVRSAIDLGARGYLCKDVGAAAIVRAVERLADGDVVLDPQVAQMLARRPRARPDDIEWLMGFLTGREREVLRRIILGQGTQEMADEMHVSRSTARTHVQNVLRKLGVHSRLEAVAAVSRRRLDVQATDSHLNGHGNGHGNGHANGHVPTQRSTPHGGSTPGLRHPL